MKILKILGVVVAVHAAAFMFVFAIPGCRSTSRPQPSPADTQPKEIGSAPSIHFSSGPAASSAGASSSGSLGAESNPVAVPQPSELTSNSDSAPAIRFSPVRPGSAVATALSTEGVADVTPAKTYTVLPGDNLWTVAKKHGTTVNELAAANNLRSDSSLSIGKKLIIPGKQAAAAAKSSTSGVPSVAGDTLVYVVKSGESLGQIAKRAGTTAGAIRTLNKLPNDVVRAGQELILPVGNPTVSTSAAEPAVSEKSASSTQTKHKVQPGEKLGQIAKRYGVTVAALATANHIANPQNLPVGKELIIPNPKSSSAPAATAASATPVSTPVAAPVSAPADFSPISAAGTEQAPTVKVEDASPISSAK